MSRKVKVKLEIELSMIVDEGVEISEIINELDYDFINTTTKATIEDTEITNHEVLDSR